MVGRCGLGGDHDAGVDALVAAQAGLYQELLLGGRLLAGWGL